MILYSLLSELLPDWNVRIPKLDYVVITAQKAIAQAGGKAAKQASPIRPNRLVPYPSTLLGLDRARRDTRYEMIKIVQEVGLSACLGITSAVNIACLLG